MKGLLPIKDGVITVPENPGVGVELDWELIERACHSHRKLEL
jgi:L-alanine-DL-glutamate epimerase-like enolase superfamily enzyme